MAQAAAPMGADERQIREVHSTWIDAVNTGDLARCSP
jgi:ketosteroid isomerase-like protein